MADHISFSKVKLKDLRQHFSIQIEYSDTPFNHWFSAKNTWLEEERVFLLS